MNKEFAAVGAVLILSLGLAYRASLPVDESDESKEWFTADAKAISDMTFKTPSKQVTAKALPDQSGFWLTMVEKVPVKPLKVEPKAEETGSPAPTPSPEAIETKDEKTEFKGSEKMAEVLASLKPFKALRVVGKADKLDLKEYGFDEVAPTFTVTTVQGGNLSLKIGKKSYGSRNTFVLDEKSQDVLLADASLFEAFESAKVQLYERRIMEKELVDFKKVKVASGGVEKALAQADRDANGEPGWRDDEEGSSAKANYKSFLDNVAKMRVLRFASGDELSVIKAQAPLLEVALLDGDKEVDRLIIRKLAAEALPEEKEPSYWISSQFLGSEAKISMNRMATFESDIQAILGK